MSSLRPTSHIVDIDKEKLKEKFDTSHFDINAVIRGAQLTLVGGMHTFTPGLGKLDTDNVL